MALQLRYEGREFGTTSLEVAVAEPNDLHHELVEPDGIALAAFDIDPPRLVPCLDLPYQLAQKLHACTEPLPGGNHRVRDVIDIWLLEALLSEDDLKLVRAAAVEPSDGGIPTPGRPRSRPPRRGPPTTRSSSLSTPTPHRPSTRPLST